jgi:hypothetical protein
MRGDQYVTKQYEESATNMNTFESPLLIKNPTKFREIRFAKVELDPELIGLRRQLSDILASTASKLPALPRQELKSIINAYAGGKNDFFALFYVPVWSFLHWAPAVAQREVAGEALSEAKTAHALSLFLHLWDDHLCDGQLPPNLLRLQFRTLAWQRFMSAAYRLCEFLFLPRSLVDAAVASYLNSHHAPTVVKNIDEYCSQFSDEFAICTMIPRLLGHGAFTAASADDLHRAIDLFSVSWRLLDDVQDIDADVMADKRTAVWLELDEPGRTRWKHCRDASLHDGKLNTSAWAELCDAISDSGCLPRLLSRIDRTMSEAVEIANVNRWPELVRELEQMRRGITKALLTFAHQT